MLGRTWNLCRSVRRTQGWTSAAGSDNKVFRHFSRPFFIFSDVNRRKVYEKKKLVGYNEEQMFSVVSDVDNYENFLPWCKKSHVHGRRENFLKGDLIIGFPPLTEKYTSNVSMTKPTYIKAECVDGRLFSYFLTIWRFSRGLKDIPQSCVIDIHVAFEFKSAIHSQISNIFFDQIVRQMEDAFIREAECRYGNPAIKSHVLGYRSS
ncbi:coenzyme Q-binding protein COQ10, mitochondrial isoform X2 [Phlebotomus argentipes]|uniref:coenzyme Q-binding protein COQ10, mitochondrial isoform X2 n=1 Tax=Phlebotomus argentipes TaxID=94469 RepID=UPI002892F4A2|nr:coenzyme Q-binding protein COQ10, mitochondrial isoform X2 [Phlebotomus argentipes]